MTTLAQLADRVQGVLSDTAAAFWSQTQIEEWVVEGVRAYSRKFPRLRYGQLIVSTGVHEVDLPTDFMGIVTVEYPEGATVPTYIQRKHYDEEDFWDNDYYDIVFRGDAVTAPQIWLGPSPTVGQFVGLQYNAYHVLSTTPSTVQTVPLQHEDIIVQYAYWKALAEFVADEASAPTSNSSLLMAQLDQLAGAALRRYNEIMAAAIGMTLGRSVVRTWDISASSARDRIY